MDIENSEESEIEDPIAKLKRERLDKMDKNQIENHENISKKVNENLEAKKLKLEKLNNEMEQEDSFEVEIEVSDNNRVLKEMHIENIDEEKLFYGKNMNTKNKVENEICNGKMDMEI